MQWPLSGKGGGEEKTIGGTSASPGAPGEGAERSLCGGIPATKPQLG